MEPCLGPIEEPPVDEGNPCELIRVLGVLEWSPSSHQLSQFMARKFAVRLFRFQNYPKMIHDMFYQRGEPVTARSLWSHAEMLTKMTRTELHQLPLSDCSQRFGDIMDIYLLFFEGYENDEDEEPALLPFKPLSQYQGFDHPLKGKEYSEGFIH